MAGAQLASLPWLTVDLSGLVAVAYGGLIWPRCRGLRWTYLAFLLHFHHLFPLDVRKYMLISIYYVDYGIIS